MPTRTREWSGMAGPVLSGKRPAALVSDPLASLTPYLKNSLRVWQIGLMKIFPSRDQDCRFTPFGSGCWDTRWGDQSCPSHRGQFLPSRAHSKKGYRSLHPQGCIKIPRAPKKALPAPGRGMKRQHLFQNPAELGRGGLVHQRA